MIAVLPMPPPDPPHHPTPLDPRTQIPGVIAMLPMPKSALRPEELKQVEEEEAKAGK